MTASHKVAYGVLLALSLVLMFMLGVKGMRFFLVPSGSMEPTLVPPEYLITFEQETYARGDIVVLRDPKLAGSFLVKRIVGVEGEVLSARGGALFINGEYASEPYTAEPIEYIMEEFTVESGQVFVLGDNRNASVDSHNWRVPGDPPELEDPRDRFRAKPEGVPVDSIVGRVRFVYLPIRRARIVKSYPLTNLHGE